MNALHSLQGFGLFALYVSSGLFLLGLFTKIYMWTTPYDDVADIKSGKMAPAITMAGAMVGFTAPLCSASLNGANVLDYAMWAVIAGVVQLIVFQVMWWYMPKNPKRDCVPEAMCYAAASISAGLINAFAIVP